MDLPDTQSKERNEIVLTDLGKPQAHFVHVHVCVHCGGAFRREECEDRVQTTGIYLCPKRGVEGPLDTEIRAVDVVEKEPSKTDQVIRSEVVCFVSVGR